MAHAILSPVKAVRPSCLQSSRAQRQQVVKEAPKAGKRKPLTHTGTAGLRLCGKSESSKRAFFLIEKLRMCRHLASPFFGCERSRQSPVLTVWGATVSLSGAVECRAHSTAPL